MVPKTTILDGLHRDVLEKVLKLLRLFFVLYFGVGYLGLYSLLKDDGTSEGATRSAVNHTICFACVIGSHRVRWLSSGVEKLPAFCVNLPLVLFSGKPGLRPLPPLGRALKDIEGKFFEGSRIFEGPHHGPPLSLKSPKSFLVSFSTHLGNIGSLQQRNMLKKRQGS